MDLPTILSDDLASDTGASREPGGCEVDDHFVNEAVLAAVEEEFKILLEFFEDVVDEHRLVLWRQLLVQVILLNDDVVVVLESLLN